MKRDDWMLLSLTFLTGLAIGMYVYIVAYKPTYEPDNLDSTEAKASEWSVVSKRISNIEGNNYIQPSFRLLGNGEYTYLPGGIGDGSLEPRNGSLSSGDVSNLHFNKTELVAFEAGGRAPVCASSQGGYDYEYRITINKESFLLDTCLVNFSGSPLEKSLSAIWQKVEGVKEQRHYDTVSDWFEDFIRRNLGVDKGN